MEILANLGINGKIFLAQVVNFFLLMYILKRFLYEPLLKIMKDREVKIKEGLNNAVKAEKRIIEIEEEAKKQMEEAAREVDKILEKAHVEAEEHKIDLIREAQEEVTRIKEEAKAALKKEKETIVAEVRKETGELAVLIAKKIIKEKISSEDRDRFLNEVEEKMSQNV